MSLLERTKNAWPGYLSGILVLLVVCTHSAYSQKAKREAQPNIILILVDDLGFSDIGPYGSEISTPNLDRLASGGMRFSQFYNTSRCCPTRAAIQAGVYPHQAGVGFMNGDLGPVSYQGYLNRNVITIAEGLKTKGYTTLMSGKWHIGNTPEQWPGARGYDKYFALIGGTSHQFYPHPYKLGDMDFFVENGKKLDNYTTEKKSADYYLTDDFTNYALKFLGESKGGSKPFFCLLHSMHLIFPSRRERKILRSTVVSTWQVGTLFAKPVTKNNWSRA